MGCMFAEMATGDPLFCGDSEIDQLYQIFRVKGTPTEETWPGVAKLPNYSPTSFPSWHSNRLCSQEKIVRALDARGLDLLTVSDHRVPLSPFISFCCHYHSKSIAVYKGRCNPLTNQFVVLC